MCNPAKRPVVSLAESGGGGGGGGILCFVAVGLGRRVLLNMHGLHNYTPLLSNEVALRLLLRSGAGHNVRYGSLAKPGQI